MGRVLLGAGFGILLTAFGGCASRADGPLLEDGPPADDPAPAARGTTPGGAAGGGAGAEPRGEGGAADAGALPTDAGAVEAGPRQDGVRSNTPSVTFAVADAPGGLRLVSSTLLLRPDGATFYVQWLAEVKNEGTQALCASFGRLTALDAAGAELQRLVLLASTALYEVPGAALPRRCLGPGQTGVLYGNARRDTTLPLERLATLQVALEELEVVATAKPHPASPTLAPPTLAPDATPPTATGSLTAPVAIVNGSIAAYAYDASGLLMARARTGFANVAAGGTSTYTARFFDAPTRVEKVIVFAGFAPAP